MMMPSHLIGFIPIDFVSAIHLAVLWDGDVGRTSRKIDGDDILIAEGTRYMDGLFFRCPLSRIISCPFPIEFVDQLLGQVASKAVGPTEVKFGATISVVSIHENFQCWVDVCP
jgi:hypothetical protein